MSNFSDIKKKFALEMNKDIATEAVDLPSGLGKATLVSMKIKEQKDFLKALEKQDEYLINEAFDKILLKCVLSINDAPVDLDQLCIQDRTFLLLMVRKLLNPKAKISHICPVSEKVYNDIEIDLNTLEVTPYTGKKLIEEISLNDNIKIKIGPVTRKDEKEIERWIKGKSKDKSLVDKRYCAYAAVIKEVIIKNQDTGEFESQELNFDNKVELIVDVCSQNVIDIVDNYIKTLDFGIKLKFNFESKDESGKVIYQNSEEEAMLISFFIM